MNVKKYYDGKHACTIALSSAVRSAKATSALHSNDIARLAAIKSEERIDFQLKTGEILTYIGEA